MDTGFEILGYLFGDREPCLTGHAHQHPFGSRRNPHLSGDRVPETRPSLDPMQRVFRTVVAVVAHLRMGARPRNWL